MRAASERTGPAMAPFARSVEHHGAGRDGTVRGPLELRVLGRPTLLRAGMPQLLGTHKSLALLCYLAAHGEAVFREQLSALLWPDSDDERARRSLRGELEIGRAHV